MNEEQDFIKPSDEEQKTEETQPTKPSVVADPPQDQPYDALTLPEDLSAPQHALDAFKKLAQEMGLTQENAQKLLDLESHLARTSHETNEAEKLDVVEEWAQQTRALYGPKSEEEINLAVRAADAFGGPELRELLEVTGLGNHPVIVRTFNEIGKKMSEDVLPGGKPAAPKDKTFAQALYGTMK